MKAAKRPTARKKTGRVARATGRTREVWQVDTKPFDEIMKRVRKRVVDIEQMLCYGPVETIAEEMVNHGINEAMRHAAKEHEVGAVLLHNEGDDDWSGFMVDVYPGSFMLDVFAFDKKLPRGYRPYTIEELAEDAIRQAGDKAEARRRIAAFLRGVADDIESKTKR